MAFAVASGFQHRSRQVLSVHGFNKSGSLQRSPFPPRLKAIRAIVGYALLTMLVHADDWPQWRGPQRDGVWREDGIMQSFPAEGLKVLWRNTAGNGWSSPVVAEGRVFLMDSELEKPKARERIRGFDVTTGKVLWTYAYNVEYPDWAFLSDMNGGPTSTPAVSEGKVYALGGNSDATCLDAATGGVIWHRNLTEGRPIDTFRCRASPLIDGARVIFVRGVASAAGEPHATCVVALDRKTGRKLWDALEEPVANSTPALITAGGQRQLIVWTDQSISSLNLETGAVLWRQALKTSNNDDNATPLSSGDRLLVSGLMFQLDAQKPGAKVLWPENLGPKRILSNTSTPWLTGDAIYSVTSRGDFVCLDSKSGKELWRTDKVTARKTGPSAHITPNGDGVFIFTDEGNLIRARLSPAGYEEISRTKLIEPVYFFGGHHLCWAPPAYAHRCIFVRSEKEILRASLAAP
jgi:outer membrane protein assembly factor BamB